MADLSTRKRLRDDSAIESDLDPIDVKKLRDDLLSFLDDSDADPTAQGLDSVMKSFEDEISPASSSPILFIEQPADSDDSRPEIGYLLEASDDELGLPPSVGSISQQVNTDESVLVTVPSDSTEICEFLGLEEQIPTYDSFELAGEDRSGNQIDQAEYAAFDGLFDQSDLLYYEPSDYSEISWRHETMPAQWTGDVPIDESYL